jgi:hypothetical protein
MLLIPEIKGQRIAFTPLFSADLPDSSHRGAEPLFACRCTTVAPSPCSLAGALSGAEPLLAYRCILSPTNPHTGSVYRAVPERRRQALRLP